jgi:hypothetical protein
MVCSSIDTHLPDVLWVGLCRENHTLTEAGRLLRGQRGCGRSVDRCVTSLRVNILHRGVLLLFVAFVWRRGGDSFTAACWHASGVPEHPH